MSVWRSIKEMACSNSHVCAREHVYLPVYASSSHHVAHDQGLRMCWCERLFVGASEWECRGWRTLRREDCVSLRSLIPCGALRSGGLLLSFLAKT